MADNIAITQGAGTTIGTDDVGGVQYQQVKLVDPTDGSATPMATGAGVTNAQTFRVVEAVDSVSSVYVTGGTLSTWTTSDALLNDDLPAAQARMYGLNGSTWDRAKLANLGSGETQSTTLRTVQATDSSSSVQAQFISRTANPTAIANGSAVLGSADDLGRQLIRPVQVRDLLYTANVTKSTGSTFGTETTLRAASAGEYLDLIYLMATNDSTVAAAVDIRSVTAGNILLSFTIPTTAGGGFVEIVPAVPIPQDASGNNWTIDCADITGTNLRFFALFSREV